MPDLRLQVNSTRGYFLSIPVPVEDEELPDCFVQVSKHGKRLHCSTSTLTSLEERRRQVLTQLILQTGAFFNAMHHEPINVVPEISAL